MLEFRFLHCACKDFLVYCIPAFAPGGAWLPDNPRWQGNAVFPRRGRGGDCLVTVKIGEIKTSLSIDYIRHEFFHGNQHVPEAGQYFWRNIIVQGTRKQIDLKGDGRILQTGRIIRQMPEPLVKPSQFSWLLKQIRVVPKCCPHHTVM